MNAQQDGLRLQQEMLAKPSDPVEATAQEDVKPKGMGAPQTPEAPERPSDEEIIEAVAQAFFVSEELALQWIGEVAVGREAVAA